jgi:hypothetical protein
LLKVIVEQRCVTNSVARRCVISELCMAYRSRSLLVALVVSVAVPGVLHAQQATARASLEVWEFTYLKATAGNVDRLAEFIRRNWFVMDAKAVAAGHMKSARLLQPSTRDSTIDLIEISVYADSASHARIDSLFRAIYRPQHVTQLVDGLGFQALGRIVRSETTRRLSGTASP